jgi:hypothetical protein
VNKLNIVLGHGQLHELRQVLQVVLADLFDSIVVQVEIDQARLFVEHVLHGAQPIVRQIEQTQTRAVVENIVQILKVVVAKVDRDQITLSLA